MVIFQRDRGFLLKQIWLLEKLKKVEQFIRILAALFVI
jgi:hypothetical protein